MTPTTDKMETFKIIRCPNLTCPEWWRVGDCPVYCGNCEADLRTVRAMVLVARSDAEQMIREKRADLDIALAALRETRDAIDHAQEFTDWGDDFEAAVQAARDHVVATLDHLSTPAPTTKRETP